MPSSICWGPSRELAAQAYRRAVPVDIDDTTSVLFAFESGVSGYLGTLFACPHTSYINVYGTGGNAFAQVDNSQLILQAADGTQREEAIEPNDTLRLELDEFAAACAGETQFTVDDRRSRALHRRDGGAGRGCGHRAVGGGRRRGLAMSARHTFFCIDGHTCGNPVRVVAGGGPALAGATMSERRQHFVRDYDWIRRALMYEPRGHDLMSGAVLYPPLSADADLALLFVETTGCLPMCGHGTIGTVTIALEHGLVSPRSDGTLILDTPAGRVEARYRRDGARVEAVRITNVRASWRRRASLCSAPASVRSRWTSPMAATFTRSSIPSRAMQGWRRSRRLSCWR